MITKKIAPDKWKHIFVGMLLGIMFQAIGLWLLADHVLLASIITIIIVASISYGWELFSKFTGKGHYEIMDAIASIIGGIAGMGIVFGISCLR